MSEAKPFCISKNLVMEAWKHVKANKGSHGVDDQSIEDFERDLKNNLYKVWNRMSSGSYIPKPVREVPIDKKDGGVRILGVPAVSDRVAQTVVVLLIQGDLEKVFYDDSYGFRPKKSAHDAVAVCEKRCWDFDWVVDLDIKGFFDNIDHELMLKAARKHVRDKWIITYIERWLKAPLQKEDGTLVPRTCGTPQGGVISPLLANLFLHYAFDNWFVKRFPKLKFERYADDCVIHAKTKREATFVQHCVRERLAECRLELNLQKTKIVYCLDTFRGKTNFRENLEHPHAEFNFLGFTFRRRSCRNSKTGEMFDGFTPAISQEARREIQRTIRTWDLDRKTTMTIQDISRKYNPILRGWFNYYGAFSIHALKPINHQMNGNLLRWTQRKYKRFRRQKGAAYLWLKGISHDSPQLLANWQAFHAKK